MKGGMESVPLCFRIIRGGDSLGLRGRGGSGSQLEKRRARRVAHWPAGGGIPKQTGGRRKEGRREGGREGEWRMSGKVMIMKNFKASLLFASSLACASYEALYK